MLVMIQDSFYPLLTLFSVLWDIPWAAQEPVK
jgi:hypothetical protein